MWRRRSLIIYHIKWLNHLLSLGEFNVETLLPLKIAVYKHLLSLKERDVEKSPVVVDKLKKVYLEGEVIIVVLLSAVVLHGGQLVGDSSVNLGFNVIC